MRARATRRSRQTVARSVWKGPFVDGYLLQKAEKVRAGWPQRSDQDLEPPLDDPAAVRRPHLRRPQRQEAHSGARSTRTWSATSSASSRRRGPITATAPTRRRRGRDHGQAQARAACSGQRGQACTRMIRIVGAEAQPRCRADPRQEGGDGARRPDLQPQADRGRRQEDARIGDRQRREQPRARRRRAGRRRGLCRPGARA